MSELFDLKLFRLLSESSQTTSDELQNAYFDFTKAISTLSRSENEHSEVFRALNLTRIEPGFIKSSSLYEQGKKCPKITLPPESVKLSTF